MARGLKLNRLLLAVVAAASMLAGCGDPPGTVVDNGRQLNGLHVNQTPQAPNQQQILGQVEAGIRATYANTQALSCDITGYFVNKDSGAVSSNAARFAFEKPNKTMITVTQSTDGRQVGTKLVWSGGSQLAVHTKFIGFWINTSVDIHDARTTDGRGYFLDQTSLDKIMQTLLDSKNQVKLLGTGNLNGVPVAQLDLKSPDSFPGISHEVFVIDGQKMVPLSREMYDASNKLVYRMTMANMQLNPSLSSDTFTLN